MSTVIKHKEFASRRLYETQVAGRPLKIEVGKVAELAAASAMVTYGGSVRAPRRHKEQGRRGDYAPPLFQLLDFE